MSDPKPDLEAGLMNILRDMDERGHERVTLDREDLRRLIDPEILDLKVSYDPPMATLEQRDTDEGIEMLREFNLAFGGAAAKGEPEKAEDGRPLPMPMYQPSGPRNLFFNESGEGLLQSYVDHLSAVAKELKERAAVLNDAGMVVIGMAITRLQLSVEELAEFWEAVLAADLVKVLDALADRQYVLDGDACMMGLGDVKLPALRIVHRKNMEKLGPDGKPIIGANGRVQKPDDWVGPEEELAALLAQAGAPQQGEGD